MSEKIEKIAELVIDIEGMDEELFEEFGVDVVSIVDQPAIGVDFLAFANEEFESYTDYPESARNNAKRALEWAEENGWGDCGTDVGKQRANQLAKGEAISRETIARMASFNRHRQNKDVPYSEGCGGLMWDAWGGTSGIDWAINKMDEFNQEFIQPTAGEDKDTFLERCMGDAKMVSEYPDTDQRYAVCNSYFEGEHLFEAEAEDAILEFCTNNGEEIDSNDLVVDLSQNEFAGVKDVMEAIQSLDILRRLSIKRDEPAEEYWRYQGPPAQRKFCRAMMNLSKAGKIFSKKDIVRMDGINKQFAKKGQSSYSVLKYKGGKNCKHYWEKLKVFRNEDGKKVVIVAQPTKKTERVAGETWANMQFSLDEEKRMITGPLMIPNKMIVRRNKDTDEPYYVYFSRNTIRKMAEKFLALNKHNNTDTMHNWDVTTSNTLVESWISESVQHDKSFKYGFALPIGTWYVSYKVNDDDTWNRIKNGELKGFSLAGPFVEKLTNEQIDAHTLNNIKKILKDVDED